MGLDRSLKSFLPRTAWLHTTRKPSRTKMLPVCRLPTVGDSWDKAVKFKINNEQTHRAVSMVLFASIAIPKGVVFFPVLAKSVHPSVCDVWD